LYICVINNFFKCITN